MSGSSETGIHPGTRKGVFRSRRFKDGISVTGQEFHHAGEEGYCSIPHVANKRSDCTVNTGGEGVGDGTGPMIPQTLEHEEAT